MKTLIALLLTSACALAQTTPYAVQGNSTTSSNKITWVVLPSGSPLTVNYVNARSSDPASTLQLLSMDARLATSSRISGTLGAVTVGLNGFYAPQHVPVVTLSGGDPDTAGGARVGMAPYDVKIVTGGTNYGTGDYRVVDSDNANYDVTLTVNAVGVVTQAFIKANGSYTNPPTNPLTITNHFAVALGSNATFYSDWGVLDVTVTNVGVGYRSAPTVTIYSANAIHGSNATATIALTSGTNPVTAGTNTLYLVSPNDVFSAGDMIGIPHTNGSVQLAYVLSVTSSNLIMTNSMTVASSPTTLWYNTPVNANVFRKVTSLGSIPWGAATNALNVTDTGIFYGSGWPAVLAIFGTNNAINMVSGKR